VNGWRSIRGDGCGLNLPHKSLLTRLSPSRGNPSWQTVSRLCWPLCAHDAAGSGPTFTLRQAAVMLVHFQIGNTTRQQRLVNAGLVKVWDGRRAEWC